MKLQRDLREFIELLNSRQIEYLVVGGHAVAYHGHPRYTGDIDFLVRPTSENAARLHAALADRATPLGGKLAMIAKSYTRFDRTNLRY